MSIPQSFIKNIALEIHHDYQLDNTPYQPISKNENNETELKKETFFWGRENLKNKFVAFLRNNSGRGVFLVTGHRGIGKTSFVNKVIEIYKGDDRKIIPIHLTITQSQPKEVDILRLVVISVFDKYKADKETNTSSNTFQNLDREKKNIKENMFFWLLLLIIPLLLISFPTNIEAYITNPIIGNIDKFSSDFESLKKSFCLILILSCFFMYFTYRKNVQDFNSYKNVTSNSSKNEFLKKNELLKRTKLLYWLFIIIGLIFLIIPAKNEVSIFYGIINNIIPSSRGFAYLKFLSYIILFPSSIFFLTKVFYLFKLNNTIKLKKNEDNAYNRIKWLTERCNTSLTEEIAPDDNNINFQNFSTNIFSRNEKRIKQYPIATSKEIEYELAQFLLKASSEGFKFVFIFDELDKVDPAISTSYFPETLESFEKKQNENDYQLQLRDRKQAILNIISGLKNFFTTAPARFIFIAGREMFDASLADISDRQSSLSSIFSYIFNIESLLKERSDSNNISLSNGIERILTKILFGVEEGDLFQLAKSHYTNKSENESTLSENGKIYFLLQNFVTYLTYRTYGSPKKLFKIIDEFILIRSELNQNEKEKTVIRYLKCSDLDTKENEGNRANRRYLYFKYYDLYRIGFISYLYRPFLIQYGRSFKHFSDNIIVSTPFLFDHLIKFHPFAFSLANLELLPEVLSTNKTPSLRQHLREIINYLASNHIKETEIGLFDYKFYSFTLNEITFISKIFETEAAAFNFTLDESYLVKLHVRGKIKELRSIYSRFLGEDEKVTQQIFSIAHLNGKLGDLHFFDQEFDDAIVAYSDAIKPINNQKVDKMNMRDFITLIQTKLKLGLCFEKINSYEEALAFYSDCCQDAKRFIMERSANGISIHELKNSYFEVSSISNNDGIYHTSSLSDLLQIVLQGFLSKLTIQEKMGLDGINTMKMSIALGGFLKLCKNTTKYSTDSHLITANAYLSSGKLLYYKNSFKRTSEMDKIYSNYPEDSADIFGKLDELLKIDQTRRMPILALHLYIMALDSVLKSRTKEGLGINNSVNSKKENFLLCILSNIKNMDVESDETFPANYFRYIANSLSNIGDCLFSMIISKKNLDKGYKAYKISDLFDIGLMYKIIDKRKKDKQSGIENLKLLDFVDFLRDNIEKKLSLTIVFRYYYWSAKFYKRYGRTVSYSFQFRKILQILRLVICEDGYWVKANFFTFLEETIVTPILNIANQNSGYTDRHMYLKADKLLGDGNDSFILNNISNNPDTREIIILYAYIKIKVGDIKFDINRLISESNSFASQYSRLVELDLHAKYVYEKWFRTKGNRIDNFVSEAVNYCFSMLSILQILKIYGTDYNVSYSFYAYTHFRLGEFIRNWGNNADYIQNFENDVKIKINGLLGANSYTSFDYVFHYQMAKEYYQKIIQLHTAGVEYKKAMGEMIYLEDDFNDNAYHFGAAFDRYMMVNDVFKNRIAECESHLQSVTGNIPNNYFK